MDSQPIRDERILEALEVCRPGSDDLSDPALMDLADHLSADPELKRLYERLRRVDGKLAAAFREVPVPEGLAQRITDRLAAARAEPAAMADVEETAEAPAPPPVTEVAARPRRVSRRRLLAAAGSLGTGAAVLVAALIYMNTRKTYDVPTVLTEAVDFFGNESRESGHLLTDNDLPDDHPISRYPISRDVRRVTGTRWREIDGFLGRKGVAYDLPGRGDTVKATLYVVKLTVSDLKDTQPPVRPQRNTANCCTAAWQRGRLLYVLVVRGGRRAYEECLAQDGTVA